MWSADGRQIYYVSDRSGTQNIWAQPLKGQARQLTNFTNGRVLWANISYDGKQIVFERNFKIWTLNTDGGRAAELNINLRGLPAGSLTERVNLSTQVRELALSPDGKKVAVVSRGEIFAASAKDGGEAARVTDTVAPNPGGPMAALRSLATFVRYTGDTGDTTGTGYVCSLFDDLNNNPANAQLAALAWNNSAFTGIGAAVADLSAALANDQTYRWRTSAEDEKIGCEVVTSAATSSSGSDTTYTSGTVAMRTNRIAASWRYVVVITPRP
jgi:hypothetical protein